MYPFSTPYCTTPELPYYQSLHPLSWLPLPCPPPYHAVPTDPSPSPVVKQEENELELQIKTVQESPVPAEGPKIESPRKAVRQFRSGSVSQKAPKKKRKSRRKGKNSNLYQKEGRNANSNFLRMFIRRLNYQVESDPRIIQSVLQKHQLTLSIDQFVYWYHQHQIDYRNYLKMDSVRPMFLTQGLFKEEAKVMRVLLKNFVSNEALPCYLTSKKVRRGTMGPNLTSIRVVIDELLCHEGNE